jgi:hypothetical protein
VQEQIISLSGHREIVARYTDKVGARPDVLLFNNDILEFVKKGATSFHASMERWTNPLFLENLKTKKEMDTIREGWDLVLDIDCPYLKYSKICAKLLLDALEFHSIKNYSVKFSGNSGFHIGVPFESFPKEINKVQTKLLFPEAPRIIAQYLRQMIGEQLSDRMLEHEDIKEILKTTGKQFKDVVKDGKFDPYSIITIDTVAISPRHLFRMSYTFNEKRWLISIPLRKKDIDGFDLKQAEYRNVNAELGFLDKHEPNEAKQLFVQAFDWNNREIAMKSASEAVEKYDIPKEAVQKQYFPPCMVQILNGLEDGRKRGLFILLNFLRSSGWDYDSIQKEIAEWNKRNKEPLRESYISSQISWHKRLKGSYLPPNCDNKSYYADIGVCHPDAFCKTNPVVHAALRMRSEKKGKINVGRNLVRGTQKSTK